MSPVFPSGPLSRRGLLHAAGASALGAALLGSAAPHAAAAPAPTSGGTPAAATGTAAADAAAFAAVRTQWATLTSGGAIDPGNSAYATALSALGTQAAAALSALDTTTGRTRLFADLPLGPAASSANVTACFTRLETLALAYTTPGTACTGDDSVLEDVLNGLDFMTGSVYSAAGGLPVYGYGNWWDWQIGAPQALEDTATLVHSSLGPDRIANYCAAIDHFVPDPAFDPMASGDWPSTGANRLDLCRVVIVRGALGEDAGKIAQGVAAISATLPFATSGDGLYADGSFLQHTNADGAAIAYTGSYGGVWLGDVARLASVLAGSPWAVTDPNLAHAFFAATDAFAPVVRNGLTLDSVRGRAIARATESDAADGTAAARNLIILAPAATDPAVRDRLRSIAKGWLLRTPAPVAAGTSVASVALAEQVLADDSVPAAPEPAGHTLFGSMDRAVHRRPGWAASISLSSERIAWYETGGGDNLRGWHTGSGMTYLYLDSDNTQYNDGFWPTVDPYRLPGTTTSRLPLADGQGGDYAAARPAAAWAGGATDGEFAAVGQDLRGPFSTLTAKKSWFCLDDAVVCLGAGITGTDGYGADTVIDNRNLGASGTAALTVDGARQPGAEGSRTYDGARWARIDGVGGYVFPGGATVTAARERRTGSWHDISTGGATAPLTRDYLTLWFDHGTDPAGAEYSYILMPGARPWQVAARAADRNWLRTLANTEARQGVHVPSLGVTAVNFFAAGTAGPLTADAPACVLVREHRDRTATLHVSDPARQASHLTVTWHRPVRAVTGAPSTLARASTGRSLSLTFDDLTGLAGASQRITVALG